MIFEPANPEAGIGVCAWCVDELSTTPTERAHRWPEGLQLPPDWDPDISADMSDEDDDDERADPTYLD